nr:uncharacterized protein LOC109755179 [Aegilops tauschii subsp. strangulata]
MVRMNENVLAPVRATTPTASSSRGLQQHIIPLLDVRILVCGGEAETALEGRGLDAEAERGDGEELEDELVDVLAWELWSAASKALMSPMGMDGGPGHTADYVITVH